MRQTLPHADSGKANYRLVEENSLPAATWVAERRKIGPASPRFDLRADSRADPPCGTLMAARCPC